MNLQLLNQSLSRNIEQIYPIVNEVFDSTIRRTTTSGQAINAKTFITMLNRALQNTHVHVKRELTKKFGSGKDYNGQYYPAMGGFCYEAKRSKVARIKIFLCIHPRSNRLSLSEESWQYFKYRFLKCLSHELVHRAQFANGRRVDNVLIFRPHTHLNLPKRTLQAQTYLGDMDEVEAYAHDCVEEWYYLNPNKPLTLRAIKDQFRNEGGRLPALQYYYETFLGDETHPSVQRLFRKIKAWDDIVHPVSLELPNRPPYVIQNAHVKRNIYFG